MRSIVRSLSFLVLTVAIAADARAQSEPNDACSLASPLAPGVYSGLQTGGSYNPAFPGWYTDYDWYRITVPAGERLTVWVARLAPPSSDLLHVDVQNPIVGCTTFAPIVTLTDGGAFALTNTAATPRDYFLDVYALRSPLTPGTWTIPYEMHVELGTSPCIGNFDRFGVGAGAAAPIAPGVHTNLTVRSDDDDSFSLRLPQGTSVEVRIDFAHASGDLDLEVIEGATTLTSTGSTDAEVIAFTASQPASAGLVQIRVHAKDALAAFCSTYALRIEVLQPALGTSHCTAGVNGYTTEARILPEGSSSVSANALSFWCQAFPGASPGILIASRTQASVPFGDGTRCVGGSIARLGSAFASNRVATYAVNFLTPQGQLVAPGTTWNYQVFYRDNTLPGGTGFNLTDGVSIPMTP